MNAKHTLLSLVLSLVAVSSAGCASTIQPQGKAAMTVDSRDEWRSSRDARGMSMR